MWIAYVAGALVLVGLVWFFNSGVRLRHKTREAFSGVDVQLKRRHDLVPNLVRVVQGYARHEQETLEEVVRLRGEASGASALPERAARESGLRRALDGLMVLVERYPDLKADANFRQLADDLVDVEDHLQYARRYYNGTVRDYNTRMQQFPGTLLAPLFGFQPEDYFQLEDGAARAAPSVSEGP